MVSLKDFLVEQGDVNEAAASMRETKALEAKCNKAVKMLQDIAKDFKKIYKPTTSNAVLYNNNKDFEDLVSKADREFGGWFGFAYDSDHVEK